MVKGLGNRNYVFTIVSDDGCHEWVLGLHISMVQQAFKVFCVVFESGVGYVLDFVGIVIAFVVFLVLLFLIIF